MAAHHTSKIRTHSRHTVRRYLAAIPWRCTRSTTSSCGACLSPCVPPSKARRDAGSDPRVASSVSQCALATRARISNLRSCRADNSMLKPKASLHIESDLLLTSFLCFAARLLAASAAACSRTRAEVDAALKNRNILEAAQSPAQALCTALRAGSIEQLTARQDKAKIARKPQPSSPLGWCSHARPLLSHYSLCHPRFLPFSGISTSTRRTNRLVITRPVRLLRVRCLCLVLRAVHA